MVQVPVQRQEARAAESVPPSLTELVTAEIHAWYDAFYRWSRGLCPNDEAHVRPIYDALAQDFRVLLTSGALMDKPTYWRRLRKLYASRRGHPPSRITNLSLQPIDGDHILATFDLFKEGVLQKKFDSALLRRAPSATSGVEWVYVHESAHDLVAPPTLTPVPAGSPGPDEPHGVDTASFTTTGADGGIRNPEENAMKTKCQLLSTKGLFMAKTGLPYRIGLTAETVGAKGLSMHVITIPPGGRALAHKHDGHESMLFLVSGEAKTFFGENLEESFTMKAGDLQYVPAGCPHLSINLSQTESCVGIVARTDPNEQESVVMLPELDELVP